MTPYQLQQILSKPALARANSIQPEAVDRESPLHQQILDECARRGWIACRSRMDKATGRIPGEPDFNIYATNGRMFHIECKRRDGKVSPEQAGFIAWAQRLGHSVHVVRSLHEFLEVVG